MTTDVQAGNILIRTAYKEPDEPVVEGDITILGQKYTSILVPQPLPNDWRWDDDRLTAEMYGVILNDLGTGDLCGRWCEMLFSDTLISLSQQNGWAERRTIKLPLR